MSCGVFALTQWLFLAKRFCSILTTMTLAAARAVSDAARLRMSATRVSVRSTYQHGSRATVDILISNNYCVQYRSVEVRKKRHRKRYDFCTRTVLQVSYRYNRESDRELD